MSSRCGQVTKGKVETSTQVKVHLPSLSLLSLTLSFLWSLSLTLSVSVLFKMFSVLSLFHKRKVCLIK